MERLGKEEVFDYYYGTEAEQFLFFRIPRVLIQDPRFKQVSTDAKLLYGLMLDRMSYLRDRLYHLYAGKYHGGFKLWKR